MLMDNSLGKKYESVADLPDDPLKMPPPYWRSGGTIFQITESLSELCTLLRLLRDIHPQVNFQLAEHFNRNPEYIEDDEEFSEITEPRDNVEYKIKLKCELAVFMAAIEIEELLNRISVFNLHKDIVESIEKLNPVEKLLIISSSLKGGSIKGSKPYADLKRLVSWRNAFAHGHCTDRPTKTLRHNHLISPIHYPTVPKEIEHMLIQIEGYLSVSKYLRSISKNEYVSDASVHDTEIEEYLVQVKKYTFTYDNNGEIYELKFQ